MRMLADRKAARPHCPSRFHQTVERGEPEAHPCVCRGADVDRYTRAFHQFLRFWSIHAVPRVSKDVVSADTAPTSRQNIGKWIL